MYRISDVRHPIRYILSQSILNVNSHCSLVDLFLI